MRRNVTVTLDEDTARWIRVEAARADMSVSQFLGEVLAERRRRAEGYEAARDLFLSREPRPLRGPDDPLPSRDEVHERSGRANSDVSSRSPEGGPRPDPGAQDPPDPPDSPGPDPCP